MKRTILCASILLAFNAYAKDVIISGNETLIQDSGKLSESGFKITDHKFINVDGVLETNIPNSLSFKVDGEYANTIVYDKKSAINPFSNMHTFYQFLANQTGKQVVFEDDDVRFNAKLHKVVGQNIFLKKEDGSIVLAKLDDLQLNDQILDAKNFNLVVSFNNKKVLPESKYHYSYFANGFQWYPNYTITMKDNNKMDFTFYGNISNNTQSNLENINLTLMTQENTNIPMPMHKQKRMMNQVADMAFSSSISDEADLSEMGNVQSQGIEDLTAYRVSGKVNLPAGIASNVLIKDSISIDYEKYNQVSLPNINSSNISYYRVSGDNLSQLLVNSIDKTDIVVDYDKNKDLTKDFLPAGEVTIMKQDFQNEKEVLIPYNKTHVNSFKKENYIVSLPKNKNVKYVANIKDKNDIVVVSETHYKEGRNNMVEREHRIKFSQYFENNSDKPELFVMYLPEIQAKNTVTPKEYKKELMANKGLYKYTVTIPSNKKLTYTIQTEIISKERK